MKPNDSLRRAVACACSAAIVAALVGGVAALELSLLDSAERELIAASGLANGWLYVRIQTGEDHVDP